MFMDFIHYLHMVRHSFKFKNILNFSHQLYFFSHRKYIVFRIKLINHVKVVITSYKCNELIIKHNLNILGFL